MTDYNMQDKFNNAQSLDKPQIFATQHLDNLQFNENRHGDGTFLGRISENEGSNHSSKLSFIQEDEDPGKEKSIARISGELSVYISDGLAFNQIESECGNYIYHIAIIDYL